MVKHGHFSLSLIRAETGTTYKEHLAPAAQDIYAEVEPEDEFYLQLGSNAPGTVYVDLSVDGMPIQKGHRLYPNMTSKVGVIRADNNGGIDTEVALRFAKAKVLWPSASNGATACTYWTGEIQATFYGDPRYCVPVEALPKPERLEVRVASTPRTTITPIIPLAEAANRAPVTYAAPKHTYYLNSKLASSDVGYVPGISDDKHKKGVKSAEGTTALRTHHFSRTWNSSSSDKPSKKPKLPQIQKLYSKPKEREPEKLCSITLKYCSAIGLIHAKILARPPDWDLEQARKKCGDELKREHEEILSKITILQETYETTDSQGTVVRTEKREILDLTRWDD
jgi:hypothetical protein